MHVFSVAQLWGSDRIYLTGLTCPIGCGCAYRHRVCTNSLFSIRRGFWPGQLTTGTVYFLKESCTFSKTVQAKTTMGLTFTVRCKIVEVYHWQDRLIAGGPNTAGDAASNWISSLGSSFPKASCTTDISEPVRPIRKLHRIVSFSGYVGSWICSRPSSRTVCLFLSARLYWVYPHIKYRSKAHTHRLTNSRQARTALEGEFECSG